MLRCCGLLQRVCFGKVSADQQCRNLAYICADLSANLPLQIRQKRHQIAKHPDDDALMRQLAPCLFLLLAACAERWEKPGVNEAEADAAQAVCTRIAAAQIMPSWVRIMTRSAGYDPGEKVCSKRRGIKQCHVVRHAGWRPAEYHTYDANAPERRAVRARCLTSQGFTFKGLRPLRLF